MLEAAPAITTDLPTITAEINAYKRVAGEALFEIGHRLKDVRDCPEKYGLNGYREWETWCEVECDITRQHANRFIKVVDELGTSGFRDASLGIKALYEIATLPPEERTREHALKSGTVKTPDEMTVRELREVKAALKAEREAREKAESRAQKAEDDYDTIRDTLDSVSEQPPQVEYVEVPNESVEARLRRYEEKFGDIEIYEQGAARIASVADISASLQTFSYETRALMKKYGFLTQYSGGLPLMHGAVIEDYEMAIDALYNFSRTMRDGFDSARSGLRVINI